MRKDDPELELGTSPEVAKEPARTPVGAAWLGVLGVLMAGTTLALFSVSAWLVGPYLLLMAWLLGAPARGRFETRTRDRQSASESGPARPEVREPQTLGPQPSPPLEPEEQPAGTPEPEAPPPKPRKGRGRGRKSSRASAPPPEPVAVSWKQVGPGQFVRVEVSHDPGPDGTGSESQEPPPRGAEGPLSPGPAGEASEASSLQALAPASEEVSPTPPENGSSAPEWVDESTLPEVGPESERGPRTAPAYGPEVVEEPADAAPSEPVVPDGREVHAETGLPSPEPAAANEPEAADEPRDENGLKDEAKHEEEEALASPEAGEGDLPQAGPFEDEGAEPEGGSPDGPAPVSKEGPEFDGESRLSFDPETSLSPTPARVSRWPVWLPRGRWRWNRRNVRGPEPAVFRPSRVRIEPRQAQSPRRRRSWHGALRYEPRAPPGPVVRRPPGVRRTIRVPHPPGTIAPEAEQAA